MNNISFNISQSFNSTIEHTTCSTIHEDLLKQVGEKIPYIIFFMALLIFFMIVHKSFKIVKIAKNTPELLTNELIIEYLWLFIIWIISLYLVFAYKLF